MVDRRGPRKKADAITKDAKLQPGFPDILPSRKFQVNKSSETPDNLGGCRPKWR